MPLRFATRRTSVSVSGAATKLASMLLELEDQDKHFVEESLLKGVSPKRLAKKLQKERFLFSGVKPDVLADALLKHRTDTMAEKLSKSPDIDGEHRRRFAVVAHNQLEAYDEMLQMYAIQRQRVNKLLTVEQRLPLLIEGGNDELELAAKMLAQIVKFEFETGRRRRVSTNQSQGQVVGEELMNAQAEYIAQITLSKSINAATKKALDIMDADVVYASRNQGARK